MSLITVNLPAQRTNIWEKTYINTLVGKIAVFHKPSLSDQIPVIFLHGVYFDHNLWDGQIAAINDRKVFAIDVPMHGKSKTNIKKDWDLDDCAKMLLEIIDSLKLEKVIAIGHSWGSMTILRAAN